MINSGHRFCMLEQAMEHAKDGITFRCGHGLSAISVVEVQPIYS